VLADPLAARVAFASRGLRPTPAIRWGAAIRDELVPLSFVAYWNDDAALRAGEPLPPPSAFVEPKFRPEIALAVARLEHARRMLDDAVREIADAASIPANDIRPRRVRRPAGHSDDVAAARAKRILRAHGFVPTGDR
jgi:hypothetical protein